MFDQLNKQRKQKNWKILNNFPFSQQDVQNNKSCFAQQPKRYCPRKNTSKQKIFSKSKQRYNSFANENVSQSKNNHQQNQHQLKSIPVPRNKNLIDQAVQTNKNLFPQELNLQKFFVNHKESHNQLLNTSCKKQQKKVNFHKQSLFSKKENSFETKLLQDDNQNIKNGESKIEDNKMILGDWAGIKEIKQEFENFKQLIIDELNKQKQFMTTYVRKFLLTFQKVNNKVSFSDINQKLMEQKINQEQFIQLSNLGRNDNQNVKLKQLIPIEMQNNSKFLFIQKSSKPVKSQYSQNNQHSEEQKWNKSQDEDNQQNQQNIRTSLQGFNQFKNQNDKSSTKQPVQAKNYVQNCEQNQQLRLIKSAADFRKSNKSQSEKNQGSMIELSQVQTHKKQKINNRSTFRNQNTHFNRYKIQKKKQNDEKTKSNQILDLQKFNNAIKKLKTNLKQIKSISDTKQLSNLQLSSVNSFSQISQLNSNQDIRP